MAFINQAVSQHTIHAFQVTVKQEIEKEFINLRGPNQLYPYSLGFRATLLHTVADAFAEYGHDEEIATKDNLSAIGRRFFQLIDQYTANYAPNDSVQVIPFLKPGMNNFAKDCWYTILAKSFPMSSTLCSG